ncbi:MAG: outer membrane protein assembly factor BamA [Elusimicrobia bacterium]|nr:outer membrane protein assembly factor BamA [Elusimicrobiota bacterium]
MAATAVPASSGTASQVAPVLAQIEFYGLKTVTSDRARGLVSAQLWKPYPPDQQARDTQTLLGSGLFTSVSLRLVALSSTAVRADFDVTEGAPKASYGTAPSTAAAGGVPPSPWVVGELAIKGERHVKRSVIRAQIKARRGDLYDRTDLDRDIEAVLGLGGFERVAADITSLTDRPVPPQYSGTAPSPWEVRLTFLIEEKPLVRKIDFPGRKKMSKGRLLDAMSLKKGDPFSRSKLREDSDKLLEEYRKKGFLRATVDPDVSIDTAAGKADVTFRIYEGPRSKLVAVRFEGAEQLAPRKLLKGVKNKPGWLFANPYSAKELPADLEKVASTYKNDGFLDAKVLSSTVTFNPAETEATLTIRVQEGPQYRYGDTTFSGQTLYVSSTLAKTLEYRKGRVFDEEKFNLSIRDIQELFAEKGRLRAVVDPVKTYNTKTGLTDVRFDIQEGPPVYVDHVDVEGYKATKPWVFTREIVMKPGQLFQVSKLRKSQQRIMNLGFIDDVQPDVQSPYDPQKADVTFEVTEGKPGMLTAGAGFSSLDGLLGTLSLQHLNLFGRAWRTSAQWSFGSRVNDFSLSWLTPWLADKPISLGLDAFDTRRLSPFDGSNTAYTSKRVGGTVRLGPRFEEDKYKLDTYYSFAKISVESVESQFAGVLAAGTSIQSTIGATFARDTRDNVWDPTSGTRHALSVDLSGGPMMGDIDFIRPSLSDAAHFKVADIEDYPLVFTLSNRLGYVTQFGSTKDVPVFERYFIGGQDTLRGYSSAGEAGARDGGRVDDVGNAELGFPLAREHRRTIVKFVLFYDIGGAWSSTGDMRIHVGQGEQDVKSDVGFGIRFTTPAVPIRLDWGYGFQHRPGETKYQINFGIGNLF